MNVFDIRNVTKSYGKGRNVFEALKDITLEIKKKDVISIMGSSGSGKTTLLNVISTIDKVTSGEIRYNGEVISYLSQKSFYT